MSMGGDMANAAGSGEGRPLLPLRGCASLVALLDAGVPMPHILLNTTLSYTPSQLLQKEVVGLMLLKVKKQACVNLMRFNKAKCRVLHLGQGNLWYQYSLGDEGIKRKLQATKENLSRVEKLRQPLTTQAIGASAKRSPLRACFRIGQTSGRFWVTAMFWWLHERVDMEMLDWDTNGTKPLHGQPLGLSGGAGHLRLDSIGLKGVCVRAVRTRARDHNQRLSRFKRNFTKKLSASTEDQEKEHAYHTLEKR
ncbi:hypothetical protein llap_10579 [Limosa lapponica baueri]|uniref:Uncharacterized protein n=1 Tax=Limosa lapponica baueri TaxID=1758121 RepID=A0A2I0TZ61_LIMLA|nr:hypothetical protein llap_10579 [Limosa lapponica baueri]